MDSGQARALIGGGWDRARVQMKRQKVRPSVILGQAVRRLDIQLP
jgi:hypothetical protein